MQNLPEPLLTRPQIAELLNVSRSYLDHAAWRGEGPPYVQVGRSIRYERGAVAQWLKDQTRTPQAA